MDDLDNPCSGLAPADLREPPDDFASTLFAASSRQALTERGRRPRHGLGGAADDGRDIDTTHQGGRRLFDTLLNAVYNHAWLVAGDELVAEDVCHEVFMAHWPQCARVGRDTKELRAHVFHWTRCALDVHRHRVAVERHVMTPRSIPPAPRASGAAPRHDRQPAHPKPIRSPQTSPVGKETTIHDIHDPSP